MKRVLFSERINVPKEVVWTALWNDEHYHNWRRSYYQADWKEGGTIHFLDGAGDGIYSEIKQLIPNEYVAFRHIGQLDKGQGLPVDNEAAKWTGAMEIYRLNEVLNATEIEVEIDVDENDNNMIESIPLSLKRLKEIAESLYQ